jgi:hypothetical protein
MGNAIRHMALCAFFVAFAFAFFLVIARGKIDSQAVGFFVIFLMLGSFGVLLLSYGIYAVLSLLPYSAAVVIAPAVAVNVAARFLTKTPDFVLFTTIPILAHNLILLVTSAPDGEGNQPTR